MKYLVLLLFPLLVISCKKDDGPTPSGSLEVLTAQSFQTKVKDASGISVVFFHAEWCTICHAQRPHIEAAAEDADLSAAFFGEIDHVDYESVFDEEGVSYFPQIWIYEDGEFKKEITSQNQPITTAEIKQAVLDYL